MLFARLKSHNGTAVLFLDQSDVELSLQIVAVCRIGIGKYTLGNILNLSRSSYLNCMNIVPWKGNKKQISKQCNHSSSSNLQQNILCTFFSSKKLRLVFYLLSSFINCLSPQHQPKFVYAVLYSILSSSQCHCKVGEVESV